MFIKVFSGKLALFLCRLYVHLSTRFIYMSIVYTLLSQKSYNLRLLSQKLGNLESRIINQNQLKTTKSSGIPRKSSGIPSGERRFLFVFLQRGGYSHIISFITVIAM
jgi:hypothetical protein